MKSLLSRHWKKGTFSQAETVQFYEQSGFVGKVSLSKCKITACDIISDEWQILLPFPINFMNVEMPSGILKTN